MDWITESWFISALFNSSLGFLVFVLFPVLVFVAFIALGWRVSGGKCKRRQQWSVEKSRRDASGAI